MTVLFFGHVVTVRKPLIAIILLVVPLFLALATLARIIRRRKARTAKLIRASSRSRVHVHAVNPPSVLVNPPSVLRATAAIAVSEHPVQPKPKRVSFSTKASCKAVPNRTGLSPEVKKDIWWSTADYEEFLRVRLELAKAYKVAARKLGVNVGGAYPPVPELAHESRRGLGLGRKVQRARNRDTYIQAVLREQERQKQAYEGDCFTNSECDTELLSRVAQRFSEKDRRYAVEQAIMYYERDRQRDLEDETIPEVTPEIASERDDASSRATGDESEDIPLPSRDTYSEELIDEDEQDVTESLRGASKGSVADIDLPTIPRFSTAAKGFGLSRETLSKAGLSCTGHKLSKYQRIGKLPLFFSGNDDDSDCHSRGSATSHDEDGGNEYSIAFAEYGSAASYRSWRLKALGRMDDNQPTTTLTRFDVPDAPEEYRAWRRFSSRHFKRLKTSKGSK
eukprot:TRINITY_DN27160_c0_g6_i1.p1 TRINITY_DN27160_c0_g6~~TRINITY_DN27160_c0_g6_i1.p1  ORF type:complete len:451 (-),score=52.25 TRINITY_DN27160_c0_g6_i1:216-1568(-)